MAAQRKMFVGLIEKRLVLNVTPGSCTAQVVYITTYYLTTTTTTTTAGFLNYDAANQARKKSRKSEFEI